MGLSQGGHKDGPGVPKDQTGQTTGSYGLRLEETSTRPSAIDSDSQPTPELHMQCPFHKERSLIP